MVDTYSERIRDRVENSDASIVLNRAAGDIRRGIERRQRLPRGIQPIGGYDVAGEWETGFRIEHRLPGTGEIAPKPRGVGDRGGTRHRLVRSQPPVTYESESFVSKRAARLGPEVMIFEWRDRFVGPIEVVAGVQGVIAVKVVHVAVEPLPSRRQ